MKVLLPILISLFAGFPAYASDNFCDGTILPDELPGDYTLGVGDYTIVTMDWILSENPDSHKMPVSFVNHGETLAMIYDQPDGEYVITFELTDNSGPLFYWNELEFFKRLFTPEFAESIGCPAIDLPRLSGYGNSESTEGIPLKFTYQLVPYARSEAGVSMLGVLVWEGGGMVQYRPVILTPHSSS